MTLTRESEAVKAFALTYVPERDRGAVGELLDDRLAAIEATVRAEQAAEVERLRAALAKALEVIRDAERELHVWVDRDRERHPGWPDVGYEPWNNKPSLALWAVDADEVEREARAALAATPVEPAPAAPETRP